MVPYCSPPLSLAEGFRKRYGVVEDAKESRPRSGGGGMLVLQELIEPGMVHVQRVSEERGRESDPSGGGDCAASGVRVSDASSERPAIPTHRRRAGPSASRGGSTGGAGMGATLRGGREGDPGGSTLPGTLHPADLQGEPPVSGARHHPAVVLGHDRLNLMTSQGRRLQLPDTTARASTVGRPRSGRVAGPGTTERLRGDDGVRRSPARYPESEGRSGQPFSKGEFRSQPTR